MGGEWKGGENVTEKKKNECHVIESKEIKYCTNEQESLLPNLMKKFRILEFSFHVPCRQKGVMKVEGQDKC